MYEGGFRDEAITSLIQLVVLGFADVVGGLTEKFPCEVVGVFLSCILLVG